MNIENLHHEIEIKVPLEKVWSVLSDLTKVKNYNPMVKEARYTSHQRRGVGSSRHCDFKDGSSVDEKVTAYSEKKYISFEASNHSWPVIVMRWTTKIEKVKDGTLVISDTEYKPNLETLRMHNIEPDMMKRQFEKIIEDAMKSMKRYIDGK